MQKEFGTPAEWIEVSHEMTALIGAGWNDHAPIPPEPAAMIFHLGAGEALPVLRLEPRPCLDDLADREAGELVFLVAREALIRLFGGVPGEEGERSFHLSTELRAIAVSLLDGRVAGGARTTYRLAKSIELLCETARAIEAGALVPVAGDGMLTAADTQRVMAARRLIDAQWNERLTIAEIARACGLNRAKLTSGFRQVFRCTVAEAIAERRLAEASRLLVATDLPVSSVGYRSGYMNNASFSRAFGRRFGVSPSDFRACRVAA